MIAPETGNVLNLSMIGRDNVSHSIDYAMHPSSRGLNRPISKYSRQSKISARDHDTISKRSKLRIDRADANYVDRVSETFIRSRKSNYSRSEVSSNRKLNNYGPNLGYLKSKLPSHLKGNINRH